MLETLVTNLMVLVATNPAMDERHLTGAPRQSCRGFLSPDFVASWYLLAQIAI